MDRTVAAFLVVAVVATGRLVFALVTGRALVRIWERAERRTDPFGFWLCCAIDMLVIAAFVAVLLGWRPFGQI